MPRVKVVCMANSRKPGGRCIAGIRVDGKVWIRPVTDTPQGTLHRNDYVFDDGTEPQLLDVVEIGISRADPRAHQPENWLVDGSRWCLVERGASHRIRRLLQSHIDLGMTLFGSYGDRIPAGTFSSTPATSSLTLITPASVSWLATKSIKETDQVRASFNLGSGLFDLVVTDPKWEQQVLRLGQGLHNTPEVCGADKVMLTISLGEPYRGDCYKLVAAVIPLV